MNAKEKRLRKALQLRPIESYTVDSWADAHRYLAPTVAAMPGKFRTSNVELGRGPMRAATEKGVRTITLKVATQLMKTTVLENILGYLIHQSPCPVLLVFPKTDLARSFSKERLNGLIRATPALKEIFGDSKQDKSEASLYYREFPGGFVALASAGSAADLAMRPIRVTLADEVDKYEALKEEGSAVLLLEERTSTFSPNDLHVRCSSPTLADTSQIEQSYNESDMRRAFIACPHCEHWFAPDFFKHVHWQKSEDGRDHMPWTATLMCESCSAIIEESERRRIITTEGGIRWQQTKPFTCCDVAQDPMVTRAWEWDEANQCGYAICTECGKRAVSSHHAGFTAGKVLSPWTTIIELATKWCESKSDPTSKQVFYNTQLGQAFEAHAAKKVEVHMLADRREKFPAALPKEILRLTCGVDDQADRLEAHVVGWSVDHQAWSVHYEIIKGDPANLETWDKLDEFLRLQWPSQWGVPMPIHAVCIDSGGHHTEMCYRFCQPKAGRNIWAIKGSSWSKRGDPVWPIPTSTKFKRKADIGFKPTVVAVDSAKDYLRDMLSNDEVGPGYLHLPNERSDAWLDQLTAEYPIYERRGGQTVRKWFLPRNRRNEAWDTLVYSYVALCGLKAVRKLDLNKVARDLPAYVASIGVDHV